MRGNADFLKKFVFDIGIFDQLVDKVGRCRLAGFHTS